MFYKILADSIVVVHFLWIIFLLLGVFWGIGSDLLEGMQPQAVVARGVWQGARLHKNGKFALLGTTVSPGFEFTDYESGQRDELIASHFQFRDLITALTKH
jgi:predicted cupin superfamily sugar epimerase